MQRKCRRYRLKEDGMKVEGSEERAPEGFWGKKLYNLSLCEICIVNVKAAGASRIDRSGSGATRRPSEMGGRENHEDVIPVVAKFVPIPNIAGPESNILSALVAAAEKDRNYSALDNEVVKALVEFKWTKFVRLKFFRTLGMNMCMIVMFTLDAGFVQVSISESRSDELTKHDSNLSCYSPRSSATHRSVALASLHTDVCVYFFLGLFLSSRVASVH